MERLDASVDGEIDRTAFEAEDAIHCTNTTQDSLPTSKKFWCFKIGSRDTSLVLSQRSPSSAEHGHS